MCIFLSLLLVDIIWAKQTDISTPTEPGVISLPMDPGEHTLLVYVVYVLTLLWNLSMTQTFAAAFVFCYNFCIFANYDNDCNFWQLRNFLKLNNFQRILA